MRLNRFLALHTGLSRRAADKEILNGKVTLNGVVAQLGSIVSEDDTVIYNGDKLEPSTPTQTILLNKPTGYVCSRNGQGSKTIYDLLPKQYHHLKPVGRLDKDSCGLLVLTNNGELANRLSHPRYSKRKIYVVELDRPLKPLHQQMINDFGIQLEDGASKLQLHKLDITSRKYEVTMTEGRNRQIRRTFSALGYTVIFLQRIQLGNYSLGKIKEGSFEEQVNTDTIRD